MGARQLISSLAVFSIFAGPDRRRAKTVARGAVVWLCRRFLSWSSEPYRLRAEPCVVFAPHQDDETLGCGALIARKRNEGLPVHVVFLTDGSASHPGHPRLSEADIQALRRREALEALAILGVESAAIHFLDEPDGTLNALPGAQQAGLVSRITALLETISPGEIFLPCCPDGSTEHDAAFAFICMAVLRSRLRPALWQYPVWSWWNPRLLIERVIFTRGRCRHATEDFGPIKARALSRYRSQIEPTPPWSRPTLPAELVRLFNADDEFFFRLNLPSPGIDPAARPVV